MHLVASVHPPVFQKSIIQIFDTLRIDKDSRQNVKDGCLGASCIAGTLEDPRLNKGMVRDLKQFGPKLPGRLLL